MNGKNDRALQRRVKQHITRKKQKFFAIVQPGFEETARIELKNIGIQEIENTVEGGIEFISKLDGCYRVNISSRTITRLLLRIAKFKCGLFSKLNEKIVKIPWELYLKEGTAIDFSVKIKNSRLYHSKKIEDEFKKGISSRLDEYGINIVSNLDGNDSEIQKIFIRNIKNEFQISIDSTGGLLYKRGSKTLITGAPIRETIAASILLEAKIKNYDILIDPMCGSGSFSLEAAGIFTGTHPSIEKKFPFMNWPSFKPPAFNYLIKSLKNNASENIKKIYASDISRENVSITKKNLSNTPSHEQIDVKINDFFSKIINTPLNKKTLIVLNPPYGNRIKNTNIKKFYRKIGSAIRNNYNSCGYAIISPGLEYEKIMSLPYNRKILFMNGGIKVAVIIKDGC